MQCHINKEPAQFGLFNYNVKYKHCGSFSFITYLLYEVNFSCRYFSGVVMSTNAVYLEGSRFDS
jgi:hypothetical protein